MSDSKINTYISLLTKLDEFSVDESIFMYLINNDHDAFLKGLCTIMIDEILDDNLDHELECDKRKEICTDIMISLGLDQRAIAWLDNDLSYLWNY